MVIIFLVILFFYAFVGNVCGIFMWRIVWLVLWFDDCCVREFDD